ncbi:MAG: ABC transporter substrate-binding protein [Chloroflexota bacterium]|nr:ABC transporter substrate-binding protein [Chloroflexota bacterium]
MSHFSGEASAVPFSLTRRRFLAGASALGAAAALAACGGSSATDTPKPAGGATTAPAAGASGAAPTAAATGTGAAGSTSAASAATKPATAAGKKGGALIMAASADAETLDPHITTALRATRYLQLLHDNLINRDFDGSFKPNIADSWTTSPDGLTYTFKLRKDVKFHSGKALTSADVKYTYERWLKTDKSPTAYTIKPITSIEAPDPQTVIFKLDKPYNILLDQIAGSYGVILNQDVVEKAGKDYGVTVVDGTGPYKFKEWTRQQRFVVERNPDYAWAGPVFQNQGPAYLDSIETRIIPEDSTRNAEFEAGNIHVNIDVPAQEFDRLSKGDKATTIKYDQLQTTYMGLNTKKAPVDDMMIRRAVGYAINRDEIVKGAYFGLGQSAVNMLSPQTPGYWQGVKDVAAAFDLDKAKATLDQAGWKPGAGGIREKNGQQLVVPFWYINDSSTTLMAQILQQQLAKAGIKLDTKPYEETAWFAAARSGEQIGFTVGVFYENADVLRFYFYSKQQPAPNRFSWDNAEMDKQLEDSLSNPDKAAVTKDYESVQKTLAEQTPAIPIIHAQGTIGVNKKVQGVKVHPSRWLYRMLDVSLS